MYTEATRDFSGQVVIATAVGSTDGDSRTAEQWGAALADRRGVPAVLAGVFGIGLSPGSIDGMYVPEMVDAATLLDDAQHSAEEQLARRRAELVDQHPSLSLTCAALAGHPGAVLADASETADLVVLGTRGMDGWSGLLFGSISQYVATHAHGPVAVVPPRVLDDLTDDDPIVLGVDGESDRAATVFAFEEARRQRRPVLAVHSWRKGDPVPESREVDVDSAGTGLDAVLDRALADAVEQYPDVEVHRQIVRGDAEIALLGASARAAMLVVGTHGRGELRSVIFGSTSVRLLGRATCPAVVVPDTPDSSSRTARGATAASAIIEDDQTDHGHTEHENSDAVETVLRLERETLSPECRRDPARLDALLADDFHEFGRSGSEFSKSGTAMRVATHESADEAAHDKTLHDLRGTQLGPEAVMVTYTLESEGRRSHHTSIWRREGAWRMLHHQGTWAD